MPLTGARVVLVALLIAATGCGDSTEPAAAPTAGSTAGSSAGSCDDLAVVGAPITGRLLLEGCTTDGGGHVDIPYAPCRGTGNVTAGLELDGRLLTGELALDWEEKPLPDRTYGTWSRGLTPNEDHDVSGCIVRWPEDPPSP